LWKQDQKQSTLRSTCFY